MPTRFFGLLSFMLTAMGIFAASGCGPRHGASVQGRVTLDAKPVADADVTFHPIDEGALAQGRTDDQGHYVLSTGPEPGLAPGEYRVSVVAAVMEQVPLSDEPMPRLLTPPQYSTAEQSPLQFHVNQGSNRIDLELKSPEGS